MCQDGATTQTLCCVTYDTYWSVDQEKSCGMVACHFPDDLNGKGLCEFHAAHLEQELDNERTVGWHEWRMRNAHGDSRILACDQNIGEFTDIPPEGGLGTGRTLRCGGPGVVLFIEKTGRVHRRCPAHIPYVNDEAVRQALMPKTAYQTGRWRTDYFTAVHPLTGTRAFCLSDDDDVRQHAVAFLAFLAVVEDHRPTDMPEDPIQPGWMGTDEDRAAMEAHGEWTHFPFIPESLQPAFGGARTIMEAVSKDPDREGE